MKKLLNLLSVLIITSGGIGNIIASTPYIITKPENNDLKFEVLSPTSLKNITQTVMNAVEEHEKNDFDHWIGSANDVVEATWRNEGLTKNITGRLEVKNTTLISNNIVEKFEDDFTNNSSISQSFKTESYSKTISNSHFFTISLNESFSVKTKFKFTYFNFEIDVNLNSSQIWQKTETTSETVISPSQQFIVNPHLKGTVDYTIWQNTNKMDGVIRYVQPNTTIWIVSLFWKTKTGEETYSIFSLKKWLIPILSSKYSDMLLMNYKDYSVFSTNNITNPTLVTFNIPITWNSQGGKLDVTFNEIPLKNY